MTYTAAEREAILAEAHELVRSGERERENPQVSWGVVEPREDVLVAWSANMPRRTAPDHTAIDKRVIAAVLAERRFQREVLGKVIAAQRQALTRVRAELGAEIAALESRINKLSGRGEVLDLPALPRARRVA